MRARLDLARLRRLWPFLRPGRLRLLLSLLLLPVGSLLGLIQPYLVKVAIDRAIVPQRPALLWPVAALLLGALLLERATLYGRSMLLERCGQEAMHALRCAVHQRLLRLRASFLDRTPAGSLVPRVTSDSESIADAFGQGLVPIIGDLLSLAGILAAMLWLSPRLALLALAVVPVLLGVTRVFRLRIRRAHALIRRCLAEMAGSLQEHIGGMKVVQVFGREAEARDDFDRVNRAHRDAYRRSIRSDASLYAIVELLGALALALLIWYAAGGAGRGISLGLLVAFIEYVQRFFVPIRDLSLKVTVMQQAMVAAERVTDILDSDDVEPEEPARAPPARTSASLELRGVRFGYSPDEPVLDELSFSLAPGESVALVGLSGAGKSTIAKLLTRTYPLQRGEICLDGVPITELPLEELRRQVVLVNQDAFLFAGDVATNISLGDPRIGRDAVEAAARAVGLHERLRLDAPVAERGANLSAGERQLVAFARALVRGPRLLVLDEATASVDPESERLVQQGMATLVRGRTCLIIAHRLATLERAARILVLNRGRIVEEGSASDLQARGGLYSRLAELQS
jgi:ATP-binding cassette, subfamily B, multidrug efflux pump